MPPSPLSTGVHVQTFFPTTPDLRSTRYAVRSTQLRDSSILPTYWLTNLHRCEMPLSCHDFNCCRSFVGAAR